MPKISPICHNYTERLEELTILFHKLQQEKDRAEVDGLVHNDKGESILTLKTELQEKITQFENDFHEFLSVSPERAQEIMGKIYRSYPTGQHLRRNF